ncbi:MAG: anthranilate synthase component I [Chloroflexi bacterium]|nr:anthranilate synthase component I [Chloroflexota bacterium]
MYYPTLEQVKALASQGNLVPVYREINADMETPVSAYLKIANCPHSFLLESVEGGERLARYSFMGTEPYRVIKTGPGQPESAIDPLILVEQELSRFKPVAVAGLPRFLGGAVGYLSYDCVSYFEPRVPHRTSSLGIPEAIFLFTDTLVVFDHLKHKIQVVGHVHLDGDIDDAYSQAIERIDRLVERLLTPLKPQIPSNGAVSELTPPNSNVTQERYHEMVQQSKDYIVAGDIIQVVPSQRLERPTKAAPFDIYRALRGVNPSPYMYFLHLDDFDIVGASPELLVRVEEGTVDTHPIAGTRPRGQDAATDVALEQELRDDEKEIAEHTMLLDLGRNDIGRVSSPGTVEVTQMMDVERYSHVMHLVSHVTGQLSPGLNAYDALRACFPAGTVSGAPKIRAMEIISELEPDARGPYAGAVGYFSFSGNMDTAIAIRTSVIKDGIAYLQAGGGVTYDSDPEREYQESLQKASALLRAIAEAEAQG